MQDAQVLIIGAGPTGLVLALWLTRLGVRVRIIDRTAGPGTTSRALAVHARTLELYRQLDLAEAVVARGHLVPGAQFWVRGRPRPRLDFAGIGETMSPYGFLEIFPQDEHERLLVDRLAAMGIQVERRTELLGFEDDGARVTARLRGPAGEAEAVADHVVGCDGARSVVRHVIGAGFAGDTYRHLFYVADVEAAGPPIDGRLHVALDTADFVAVFPLAGEGRARLIGTVKDTRADRPETLGFDDVSRQAIEHLHVAVKQVHWFSTYHVHHRVTDRFRRGRAFLAGDAAHIHSPVGGQGMNTGIGDAINLAWKLAAVVQDRAPDRLLDSYQQERIGFARRLVATTDRIFGLITADGALARVLRMRVLPLVLPALLRTEAMRRFAFQTVSQIGIEYRGSALSRGRAGRVRGGDRLPWVGDNYAPLAAPDWQVHVYGTATPALAAWCATQRVPLHVFAWDTAHGRASLARNAAYLLRPDTYVAVAGGDAETFARFFAAIGWRATPP